MTRRVAIAFLVLCNVALGILVLYFLSRGYQPPPKDAQTIEYKDFISILLTGLAVMIAVMTVFLAAAAIWGYERIRKDVLEAAEKEARTVAKDVAQTVAVRTARDVSPSETTSGQADALVEALTAEEAQQ
ncbi:MAG: hypothetical protein HY852_22690 [Bradyrhizobium sp.]|uniref:hypothetical protein n=1 Tax=Bradyrhizobium sp. TaxID=376 RepID=UPI0025BD26CE|nr:hypothetical protein [Bradyrhizobium sp.]MBI5264612.1 hypothetical protein [Bradyrhizobium sp.]